MSVQKAHLVVENDPRDTLGIPEQLIHVVIANDILVILLPPYKLPFDNLITLVPYKPVQRLDDSAQVESLRYGLHSILTLWRSVIVVGALEDEA